MVVSQDVRGQGVGRALSQETFALALGAGLEKLSVQMTVDQRGAITLFESLGFKAEALLRDHVRDVDGKTHDIVVLGHNVAQVRAQMEALWPAWLCGTIVALLASLPVPEAVRPIFSHDIVLIPNS